MKKSLQGDGKSVLLIVPRHNIYIENNQKTVNKNTIKENIYTKKIKYLYLDCVQLYIWISRFKILSLLLAVIEIYYYLLHQI